MSPLLGKDWVRAVVDRVNAQAADVLVLTGDLVDGMPAARAESAAELRRLRARHGVLACAGNHEYYSGFKAWTTFSDLGITMLLNGHQVLGTWPGAGAGQRHRPVAARAQPEPGPGYGPGRSAGQTQRILLDHRPGIAAQRPARCGFAALRPYPRRSRAGLERPGGPVQLRGMCGVGTGLRACLRMSVPARGSWNGFPLRVDVPSEIALIAAARSGRGRLSGEPDVRPDMKKGRGPKPRPFHANRHGRGRARSARRGKRCRARPTEPRPHPRKTASHRPKRPTMPSP